MIHNFRDVHKVANLSLRYFAEILDRHIRFEERVLFPLIEKVAMPGALLLAGGQLEVRSKPADEWNDVFWIKKN